TLHIGGQIGWDGNKVFVSDEFVGQMEQALKNIADIVEAAGGTVEDVVRLTWYVTDKKDYLARQREVGEAYRRAFGRHFPAMSMLVVSELIEDAALVEIEATAYIGTAQS
ncbi:MAG: RidA family protein, partial [Pseudomonadota bacterium]